jgi:hypothetical protein
MKTVDANKTYIAVVEENNDPKKSGRVRARVLDIFDDLTAEDIPWAKPWKDLNGNAFNIPDKGKVVTVIFESGNIYKPEYICADHFNVNLEKKLSGLSVDDYLSMKSLIFDHKTQIYVNESEGLKLDHKFNMVNIRDTSINVNLKDNFGKINLGTANSTQRAILGDNFLNWFDDFVQILLGGKGGPFLGNLGAPVIATPALMANLQIYQQKKVPKFLSKNVYIVDNENVAKLDRIHEGQKGDTWKSTVKENDLAKKEPVPFTPTAGASGTQFDKPKETPMTASQSGIVEMPTETPPIVTAKPKPADNPDVAILIELLRVKNYTLYERPFEVNIVAIRNQCLNVGEKYTDEFVDKLYIMYKDDTNNWDIKQYSFSTMPGVEFTVTEPWINERRLDKIETWLGLVGQNKTIKDYYSIELPKARPDMDPALTILVPSQYINVYQISTYKGAPAMVTNPDSLQLVYLDKDFTRPYDFTPSNYTAPFRGIVNGVGSGDFKIWIHRGYPGGKRVGDWSEGSHVFPTSDALNEFFGICNKHKDKYGNAFTYTLATKTDWDDAERSVEINKTDTGTQSSTGTQSTPEQGGTQSSTTGASGTSGTGVTTTGTTTGGTGDTSANPSVSANNTQAPNSTGTTQKGLYDIITISGASIANNQVTFTLTEAEKNNYDIVFAQTYKYSIPGESGFSRNNLTIPAGSKSVTFDFMESEINENDNEKGDYKYTFEIISKSKETQEQKLFYHNIVNTVK